MEQVCGVLGNRVQRAVGTEVGRGVKDAAQLVQLLTLVQRRHRDFVPHRLHAGEVGLYADGAEGGYDEQRRRLQMHLVAEQLVKSGV